MKLDNLEVSFALYRRVSVLRDLGRRLTIQPGHDGDCPNCQDVSGFMYMFLLETESEHYEPGMLPMSSGGYGRFYAQNLNRLIQSRNGFLRRGIQRQIDDFLQGGALNGR